jgi:hypothetical protein
MYGVTIEGLRIGDRIYWTLTIRNYNNSSWIYTIYNSLRRTLSLLMQLCLHQSSSNRIR